MNDKMLAFFFNSCTYLQVRYSYIIIMHYVCRVTAPILSNLYKILQSQPNATPSSSTVALENNNRRDRNLSNKSEHPYAVMHPTNHSAIQIMHLKCYCSFSPS